MGLYKIEEDSLSLCVNVQTYKQIKFEFTLNLSFTAPLM